jgi:hypothetical protein
MQEQAAELQAATEEEERVLSQIKEAAKAVAAAQRALAKREAQVNAARHAALNAESEIEGLTEQIVGAAVRWLGAGACSCGVAVLRPAHIPQHQPTPLHSPPHTFWGAIGRRYQAHCRVRRGGAHHGRGRAAQGRGDRVAEG